MSGGSPRTWRRPRRPLYAGFSALLARKCPFCAVTARGRTPAHQWCRWTEVCPHHLPHSNKRKPPTPLNNPVAQRAPHITKQPAQTHGQPLALLDYLFPRPVLNARALWSHPEEPGQRGPGTSAPPAGAKCPGSSFRDLTHRMTVHQAGGRWTVDRAWRGGVVSWVHPSPPLQTAASGRRPNLLLLPSPGSLGAPSTRAHSPPCKIGPPRPWFDKDSATGALSG